MIALRRVAAAAATALLIPAALGSCNNVLNIPACNTPTLSEKGADGGPDPCHCDPSPSLNITTCGCLSDPSDQQAIDDFQQCIFSVQGEEDAGAEGGP